MLQGSADLQGFGNSVANAIYGNSGNNILDGDVGADLMVGGAGNDAYFVDNAGDAITENANEGTDTVYSTAHLRLTANLENLLLQGSADLQGYGNACRTRSTATPATTCSTAMRVPTRCMAGRATTPTTSTTSPTWWWRMPTRATIPSTRPPTWCWRRTARP